MTRLARMRPATLTRTCAASSASVDFPPYAVSRSAASALRRKSFGKAMPRSRNFASFALRSPIRWFSSLSLIVANLQTLFQAGLHEFVERAVEHCGGIADLHPGTQVLDARLIEHVAA